MKTAVHLLENGGPVIYVLIGLSLLLYGRCFQLLGFLGQALHRMRAAPAALPVDAATLRRQSAEIEEAFHQQELPIVAMIAAAPLCGLLGTVTGMIRSFASLSSQGEQGAMGNLARGISEVLIDTESGLAVAIPALLLLCFAHGILHRAQQRYQRLELRPPA